MQDPATRANGAGDGGVRGPVQAAPTGSGCRRRGRWTGCAAARPNWWHGGAAKSAAQIDGREQGRSAQGSWRRISSTTTASRQEQHREVEGGREGRWW
jgi:hypothetical protein